MSRDTNIAEHSTQLGEEKNGKGKKCRSKINIRLKTCKWGMVLDEPGRT